MNEEVQIDYRFIIIRSPKGFEIFSRKFYDYSILGQDSLRSRYINELIIQDIKSTKVVGKYHYIRNISETV